MTVKQILIGTLIGSSIVGMMVHRLHKAKIILTRNPSRPVQHLAQKNDSDHKVSSFRRKNAPWFNRKPGGSPRSELG